MKDETAARLLTLNEQFYQTFGSEFSSTRQRLQPGVLRILETFNGEETILDLGCGNGGLARVLSDRAHRGVYLGLDFSPPMLQAAGAVQGTASRIFVAADLASPDWDQGLPAAVHPPFDLITAFAVLHHIPGRHARAAILDKVHALLRPQGRFIHSEWQFLNSEKLASRVQPWELAGLTATDVDPGDALLDWRGGGRGLRYVHHFNEAELLELAAVSGFEVLESFLSDGRNGRLGLYQVWNRLA